MWVIVRFKRRNPREPLALFIKGLTCPSKLLSILQIVIKKERRLERANLYASPAEGAKVIEVGKMVGVYKAFDKTPRLAMKWLTRGERFLRFS